MILFILAQQDAYASGNFAAWLVWGDMQGDGMVVTGSPLAIRGMQRLGCSGFESQAGEHVADAFMLGRGLFINRRGFGLAGEMWRMRWLVSEGDRGRLLMGPTGPRQKVLLEVTK